MTRVTMARQLIAAASVLLCSCSLFKAREAEVYLQPRLVETARDASQESAASVASLAPTAATRQQRETSLAPEPGMAGNRQQKGGAPPAPAAAGRQAAFTLSIDADPGLNRFRESAHALHLCVYQLKEPNGFRQLGEEKEGLARLMECGRFDGSVAHASRMVVQPGERIRQARERAEGVRYLGIATGYYGSARRKTLQLVPFAEGGAVPATAVSIELGPGEIANVTVN